MTAWLYIFLGILVVALAAAQLWIARSQGEVAGDRGRLVRFIRTMNVVLMVAAILLAVYTLTMTGR